MGQQQMLLVILGVIVVTVAIAVGIEMINRDNVQSKQELLINGIDDLAFRIHQYYITPTTIGGGGNSYQGLTMRILKPNAMMDGNQVYIDPNGCCYHLEGGSYNPGSTPTGAFVTLGAYYPGYINARYYIVCTPPEQDHFDN